MNSSPSQWSDFDASLLEGSGVYAFGIVRLSTAGEVQTARYCSWIAGRRHGTMTYMERYGDIRRDPRLLLEGARSMICCAFSYYTSALRQPGALSIARYALGKDYHDIVRRRLEAVAERIRLRYGGETRVCVDTAPLYERYWAARAGLGVIGLNNQLIIPGAGSYFFLGEILTTAPLNSTADISEPPACEQCGRCVRACPTGALNPDGSCDASRCLSYLTIENRDEFPDGTDLHGRFYGCDCCAEACPHNANPPLCAIDELKPNPRLLSLTADEVIAMTREEYTDLFRGSAMKRAKLSGLQRNALQIKRNLK